MSAWLDKVAKFKYLLDIKISDHKSSVELVRSNLHSLAQGASSVQPRLMFEFALECPLLIGVPPDAGELQLATIYDIIQHNMVEAFVSIGLEYLETFNVEQDSNERVINP